ncbi:MAG: leucine-rich repeat protein [Bacteroidales bacterium]|nr:leucine-rich repeat protein [Bacteroidales bacterium]
MKTIYQNSLRSAWTLLFGVLFFASCGDGDVEEPESAACEILSFSVDGEEWTIGGTDITRAYPEGTAARSLTPAITLSPGATVNPPANRAQDFFTEAGVAYTVTAEDGVATKTYVAKATVQASAIPSGITGDCAWTLTGTPGNYTLAISGPGAMEDYASAELVPWYSYRSGIKTLSIGEGVTSVGAWAFSGCTGLTSISIPASTASIADYAFASCTGLTDITLNGTTPPTIVDHVFLNVNKGSITLHLPEGVTPAGCIAAGWTGFVYDAPSCPAAEQIGDSDTYGQLCDDGTLTVSGNGAMTVKGYGYRDGLLIPVMPWTDSRQRVKSVIITQGVTSVYGRAFYDCRNLQSAVIPPSVTAIGYEIFRSCSSLADLTVSWTEPEKLPTLGDLIFYGLTPANITLHVPAGTKAMYEAADVWKGLKIAEP